MMQTVLLIDDDEAVRLRLRDVLEREQNYDIRERSDGRAGLAEALAAPPDLVLLDLMMPGLTGFEVMNETALDLVRRHFPQAPQPLPRASWTVLLEQSDTESEAHAREAFEGVLGAALEALDTPAVVLVAASALAESSLQALAAQLAMSLAFWTLSSRMIAPSAKRLAWAAQSPIA